MTGESRARCCSRYPAGRLRLLDGALTRSGPELLLGQYIEGAVRRANATRYQAADVQRWLSALADGLAWQARHAKSATDIELATWWQPSGRRATQLVHSALLLLFPVVTLAWLFDEWSSGGGYVQLDGIPVIDACGVAACLLVLGALAVRSPSPRRFRARQLITWRGARRFARGLVLGFFLGAPDVIKADARYMFSAVVTLTLLLGPVLRACLWRAGRAERR